MNKPRSLELLRSEIPARVAYSAADGFPRVIPVGSVWNGETLIFCSPPNAAKVGYLAAHPNVAITIDSNDFPPIALYMRGTAALETVDGVPDAFIEAARPRVPAEMMADWEAGTRALYKQMTVITITPHLGQADRFRNDASTCDRGVDRNETVWLRAGTQTMSHESLEETLGTTPATNRPSHAMNSHPRYVR